MEDGGTFFGDPQYWTPWSTILETGRKLRRDIKPPEILGSISHYTVWEPLTIMVPYGINKREKSGYQHWDLGISENILGGEVNILKPVCLFCFCKPLSSWLQSKSLLSCCSSCRGLSFPGSLHCVTASSLGWRCCLHKHNSIPKFWVIWGYNVFLYILQPASSSILWDWEYQFSRTPHVHHSINKGDKNAFEVHLWQLKVRVNCVCVVNLFIQDLFYWRYG